MAPEYRSRATHVPLRRWGDVSSTFPPNLWDKRRAYPPRSSRESRIELNIVHQRQRSVPQLRPAPKPEVRMRSPDLMTLSRYISSSAMGIEPAEVLP